MRNDPTTEERHLQSMIHARQGDFWPEAAPAEGTGFKDPAFMAN